jgi:hypothetical protein
MGMDKKGLKQALRLAQQELQVIFGLKEITSITLIKTEKKDGYQLNF